MYERQEERLSPLPEIGEGFGEWSEAPSYEEGVGVDGSPEACLGKKCRAGALQEAPRKGASPMEVSLDDETSIGLEGEFGKPFLP
jgi:hypothetical protein